MVDRPLKWLQVGEFRWVAQDIDGYSLRVRETDTGWAWSLWVPGGDYSVSKGVSMSKEEATMAVEAAYDCLTKELASRNAKRTTSRRPPDRKS